MVNTLSSFIVVFKSNNAKNCMQKSKQKYGIC